MLPPVIDAGRAAADVDRAVLTTVFHIRSPFGLACALATLRALRRVAHEHGPVYRELVRASMTAKQIQQTPKDLLEWDDEDPLGPMELTGAYYVRGHEEGRVVEARRMVLRVLGKRGLTIDDAQRERIDTCEDLERLEQWLDRALIVSDVAALFD